MDFTQLKRKYNWPRLLVFSAIGLALVAGLVAATYTALNPSTPAPALSAQAFPTQEPTLKYGVAIDTFTLNKQVFEEGETLSDLLDGLGITGADNFALANRFNTLFDVRNLRAGKPYQLMDDPDTEGVDYLVYLPSIYEYVKLDLRGGTDNERVRLPVETSVALAGGHIESNLWNAMTGAGMSWALTERMEDALQWSVDFHHVQPKDAFQLVYEKKMVEGEVEADPGRVLAARYSSSGQDNYVFWFESPTDSTLSGYYGLNGEPMKASFLKSPVRFSRVSSAYNLRRFHPVLKRRRPHLGTDYAAPYGTPILSVADGIIVERTRRGGNGNFVKVKHNDTYTTQYLHMQKFANGQRVGTKVQQGEVIGYVGSTGLATGPHTCFRFWKNGKQIDHTKLKFPPARTMPDSLLPAFEAQREVYLAQLNQVGQPSEDTDQQILEGLKRMEEMRGINGAK